MKRHKTKREKVRIPTVRGEKVTILGKRPCDFKGRGADDPGARTLVRFSNGEKGVVHRSDIQEGAK